MKHTKGLTISLIDLAWIIYSINFVTGIDLVKLVTEVIGGKANLKALMTAGTATAMKKLQADPLNTILVLGIAYLIKDYAKKTFGRKRIIDLGGFKVTL